MQKKLIALAVASLAAGSAFAQSNVTISGIAAVSYNNYKVSKSLRTTATENRLDDDTSRFTIKGSEDLGSGLSAYFQIENRVSLDSRPNQAYGNAQGLADGESFVGLKHKDLGSVGLGKFAYHYHETFGYSEQFRALNNQAYSTDIMSAVAGGFIAFNSRSQNAIKYDSPNWAGFAFKLGYSFNPAANEGTLGQGNNGATTYANNNVIPTTATVAGVNYLVVPGRAAVDNKYNKGSAWNVAGRYNNGPINAYVSYWDYKVEGGSATSANTYYNLTTGAVNPLLGTATSPDRGGQKSWKIGGDYTFGFGLTAGLHYDSSKVILPFVAGVNVDLKRTAWMLPLTYKVGAHGVYLTYMRANDLKIGSTKMNDTGAKKWVLAYDYGFSKRTFVGASYMQLTNDRLGTYTPWLAGISTLGGSNLAAGEKARQFSVNVSHFF